VWQVLNLALLALVELALIWRSGPAAATRFYLAAWPNWAKMRK
jgi:hypothetical protein